MFIVLAIGLFFSKIIIAQEKKEIVLKDKAIILPIVEFIELAVQHDTEFEKILIDELFLNYQKALKLPAGDLVFEVKSQYDFILDQKREEPEGSLSLSKLFPLIGTSLTAEYSVAPSYTSTDSSSEFSAEISQPIAKNAFGKATRLKDKIIGVEIDVARYQIIEAYEDYLATIIAGYYDWYEAYENLKVGNSSYRQDLKLLDNIMERQKNDIALPIDVNKVHLQVFDKKEKLIVLEEVYDKTLNFVKKAIRYDGAEELAPKEPDLYAEVYVDFDKDYEAFRQDSRTYEALDLLEKKSKLEVDQEADDLLPSIDLLIGYSVQGKDLEIRNKDSMAYAGLSLEWPFGHQVDRAEYETSKLSLEKTKLSNIGTHFKLYTDIKDLSVQINNQQGLLDISKKKIDLAEAVLKDEAENYSFGRVTLNDYISAVNVLDNNRFNEILHKLQYKKLVVEWLRITDKLISRKDIYR